MLLNNVELLNNTSTYNLCPSFNKYIFDEIDDRKNIEKNLINYYNTDFICRKCKFNKTTVKFIHKHLGNDEASSLEVTCVNCKYSWIN